jgi:hypothetical protein
MGSTKATSRVAGILYVPDVLAECRDWFSNQPRER